VCTVPVGWAEEACSPGCCTDTLAEAEHCILAGVCAKQCYCYCIRCRYGMVLQQCAHFYNNIATEMIPCQKPLMLADAVEFEKVSDSVLKRRVNQGALVKQMFMQRLMQSTAETRPAQYVPAITMSHHGLCCVLCLTAVCSLFVQCCCCCCFGPLCTYATY
jgi:hypothetical protein